MIINIIVSRQFNRLYTNFRDEVIEIGRKNGGIETLDAIEHKIGAIARLPGQHTSFDEFFDVSGVVWAFVMEF